MRHLVARCDDEPGGGGDVYLTTLESRRGWYERAAGFETLAPCDVPR